MAVRKLTVLATSLTLLAGMGAAPAFAKGGQNYRIMGHFGNYSNAQNVNVRFNDVNQKNYGWASEAIYKLSQEGVISGMQNNNMMEFNPGGQLTRSDFATLLTRFFHLKHSNSHNYKDVQSNAWYSNAANAAGGYMPTSSGNFNPGATMTRAEAAASIVRVLAQENAIQVLSDDQANQVLSQYTDAGQIPVNLRNYVATAIQFGLLSGVNANEFDPNGILNRAQIAQILSNIQDQSDTSTSDTSTATTDSSTTVVAPGSTISVGAALTGQLTAPSSTVIAGESNDYTFTVYQNGSVDTEINGSYDVTVSTSSSGSNAASSTVTFTNGVATLPISLTSTGTQTISVTVTQLGTSASATVSTQ